MKLLLSVSVIIATLAFALGSSNAQAQDYSGSGSGGLFGNKSSIWGNADPDYTVSGLLTLALTTTSAKIRLTGCGGQGAAGDYLTSSSTKGTVGGPGGGGAGVGEIFLPILDPGTSVSYYLSCGYQDTSTVSFVSSGGGGTTTTSFSISCATGGWASGAGPMTLPGSGSTCTIAITPTTTPPPGVTYTYGIWAGGAGQVHQTGIDNNHGGNGSWGGQSGLKQMAGIPGQGGNLTSDGQVASPSLLQGTGGSGGGGRGKGTNTPAISSFGGPARLEVWSTPSAEEED